MKVTLWMGMSLNGIIARENNEEDFISHDSWVNWVNELNKTRCTIFGRRSYEIVRSWPKEYSEDIKDIIKVIVSSNKEYELDKQYLLASSPEDALKILETRGFTEVTLTGGSKLDTSFAKKNLIDKIILFIEPVIVGKGIPLFDPDLFDLKLQLINVQKTNKGNVLLHYRVVK